MNVEQRLAATIPQTKPPDLGCESVCRQLSSTTTIAIYYYYSARKLIFIYHPTEGRRLSWPRHCRKDRQKDRNARYGQTELSPILRVPRK